MYPVVIVVAVVAGRRHTINLISDDNSRIKINDLERLGEAGGPASTPWVKVKLGLFDVTSAPPGPVGVWMIVSEL